MVVVTTATPSGRRRVAVAPVTSQKPATASHAVEVPRRVLAHLGLPAVRSWVICDEYNVFAWPGTDLAVTPSGQRRYGFIPDPLIERIRAQMRAARDRGELKRVPRSE